MNHEEVAKKVASDHFAREQRGECPIAGKLISDIAAAEIERLRARVAELEAQRDRWKAIAEKRHAILLDLEWVVDAKDGDGSYCPYCMSMDDEVHVAGCKMAEAIAESARAANGGGE